MLDHLRRSVTLAIVAFVLFGFVYALLGTGLAQLFFRGQADGSITPNGSTLIGQNWNGYSTTAIKDPQWFHGRPDADDPLGRERQGRGVGRLEPRSPLQGPRAGHAGARQGMAEGRSDPDA